jgi:hypothetical protein
VRVSKTTMRAGYKGETLVAFHPEDGHLHHDLLPEQFNNNIYYHKKLDEND